jgi:lipopolysaccharide/colanic/teichoic acid biosynthesis glycosyltransferase
MKSGGIVFGVTFGMLAVMAVVKKRSSIYGNDEDQKNPMENKKVIFVKDDRDKENADGIRGHLEAVGDVKHNQTFYEKYIKRIIDIILSFIALVLLSPVYIGVAIAIMIDDPGPVLFTQKRIGKNKQYFKLHKFRSMKMATPHDVPTHMLVNPDQYITKVGHFIRRHSIDELPQVWDIFIGNMSIIGPRPALWNQDVLTAERDKWGANDVKPGLTGWAQINGRDELELTVKAKLDGKYSERIKGNLLKGFLFDCHCFFGTIFSVVRGDGIIEGGTGEMKKHEGRMK